MEFELYNKSECKLLLEMIENGSCVLFFGSGLSNGIYPDWETLIRRLCERCGVKDIVANDILDTDTLLIKADEAKSKDPVKYDQVLQENFAPVVHRREAYELIMRLKFKFYITTNFDPLLASETNKPENNCKGVYRYPDLPYRQDRAAYYIHGIIDNDSLQSRQKIILGKQDFDAGYSDRTTLHSFLHQVLTYEPILFVGCGLKEPQLKEVFRLCHESRKEIELFHGVKAPDRYILLPYRVIVSKDKNDIQRDIKAEDAETLSFLELGIKIIRYNPIDRNHSGLEEIFREWCKLRPFNILKGFDIGDS